MPFKKGKSGNPGGRKKPPEEFLKACQAAAPQALEYMIQLSRNPAAEDAYRIKAAIWIAERAYGKAPQSLEVAGKDGGDIVVNVNLIPRGT